MKLIYLRGSRQFFPRARDWTNYINALSANIAGPAKRISIPKPGKSESIRQTRQRAKANGFTMELCPRLNRRQSPAPLPPALPTGRKLIGKRGRSTDGLRSNPWVRSPVVDRHRGDRLRPARLIFLAWSRNRRHPRPHPEPRLAPPRLDRHRFNRSLPNHSHLGASRRLPRPRLFRGRRMLAPPVPFAISVRLSATLSGLLAAR